MTYPAGFVGPAVERRGQGAALANGGNLRGFLDAFKAAWGWGETVAGSLGLVVRDARLRPMGYGGLLTMRVEDLIPSRTSS
jgi:hypothetical protein